MRDRVVNLGELPPDTPPSGPDLQNPEVVARLLRRLYCLHFRLARPDAYDYGEFPIVRWDGGSDRSGRTFKPVWPKLAEFMLANDIDPFAYVRNAFAAYRGKPSPPTPPQLQTPALLDDYRRYKNHIVEELTFAWDRQCLEIDGRRRILLATSKNITEDAATITALMDTQAAVATTPLFRYCASFAMNLAHVAEVYHDEALVIYVYQKLDYDAAWGEKIPAGLRTEADAHRLALSS